MKSLTGPSSSNKKKAGHLLAAEAAASAAATEEEEARREGPKQQRGDGAAALFAAMEHAHSVPELPQSSFLTAAASSGAFVRLAATSPSRRSFQEGTAATAGHKVSTRSWSRGVINAPSAAAAGGYSDITNGFSAGGSPLASVVSRASLETLREQQVRYPGYVLDFRWISPLLVDIMGPCMLNSRSIRMCRRGGHRRQAWAPAELASRSTGTLRTQTRPRRTYVTSCR